MQVESTKSVSDIQSIQLGAERIIDIYDKVKLASDTNRPSWVKDDEHHLKEIIHRTAWFYNNSTDYSDEVFYVFGQIRSTGTLAQLQPKGGDLYNAYYSRPRPVY